MRLKVLSPSRVVVDEPVTKVVAEAEDGCFCLLPRHVDFVAALVPGILSFAAADGAEGFVAVDEGILLKSGPEVLVSTREAVRGPSLEELRAAVETALRRRQAQEAHVRSAMDRLEADIIRELVRLGDEGIA